MVLDVLMPGVDGHEVCRRLRSGGDATPILVLTARSGVADRVEGLDAGADDYLVKPFAFSRSPRRLRLRCSGAPAAQRARTRATTRRCVFSTSSWTRSRTVQRGSREVALTRTEYLLLELSCATLGRC